MVMSPQLQQIMELEKSREQQEDNTTTSAQQSPELKAVLEAEQKLETGKGLPEPAPVPFTAGSDFESDIQSVYLKGKSLNASPEEIANMIKAKYGDKYLIEERKVSQQEKDDLWTPEIFVADKEYIVRDPLTKEALSLDNPGFSQSQALGAGSMIIKELPTAIATRGRSLGTKMLGMGATGSAVNTWDQSQIKKFGGKEEVSPWEVGLAGAFTAGGELFGPVLWSGTKLFGSAVMGLGRAVDTIGRRLEIGQTKKNVSDILGTKVADDIMTKAEAEEAVAKIQNGWTAWKRNDMYKKAQEQEKLYGNLVSSLKGVELTPAQKLQLLKDMNLTPAERGWNPTLGEFNQTSDVKNAIRDEETLRRYFPEYSEQLDRRLEDVASLVDRPVAETSTTVGRELAVQKGLMEELEKKIWQKKDLIERGGYPKGLVGRWEAEVLGYEAELKKVNNTIKELEEAAKTESTTRALSKEDLGDAIIRNVSESHDDIKKLYKDFYEAAKRNGKDEISNEMFDEIMPWEYIRQLPEEAKPIIAEFESMLVARKNIAGDVIKPTLNNIDDARKFLKGQIDKLYTKTNTDFKPVLADKLNRVVELFDNNVDIYVGKKTKEFMDESSEAIAKLKEEYGFSDEVAEAAYATEKKKYTYLWSKNIKEARGAFTEYKKVFGDKALLKKIVDEVDKGQKSVSQITNMLIATSGEPKFGADVVKSLENDTGVKDAIKDYIYATTFFDDGNILTGQKVTTRFNKVKNSEAVKEIFGNDWEDFVDKANKLQQLDVVRGKQGRGSPTQPRQEDQNAYGILTGKKDFWVRALDAIGGTKDAKTDAQNKQALKEYVLQTVYGYTEPPKIKEGLPSYIIRPTRAALAQEEAQFTDDIRKSATSDEEDNE